ncbi:ABC transporter ATP-binding protein [Ethanoligenens harbinense]|uniref:ABC transporter related protein n=1 Tax=Ethanoligenens harbinense (strain DSM 18485 / JCM 12961 / CGMCC 1.5033 / YUAN-3) TaxID=663278 RepID=E6U592_ETHHY|nr:ABC transporter ATP-binding protein [Ethanoligenens harbinense]ADU27905.1 ABC transporter related protein [Ethanoligenens harbinense YUAN-3]AVQ96933.1 ABC transporter ATP-binding protein [Ethanoligenens harbinense YUAN-3]AYF39594.1 ABC transporter ATP-binding protein [Ethanoligenens harbinense]AYF42420.1 ABC transporter ATP-binding protein [Ethanoligenens harbinense]QCN93173.1 ABC transporter ATP-binding protein [Ethanoligenens harbinense]
MLKLRKEKKSATRSQPVDARVGTSKIVVQNLQKTYQTKKGEVVAIQDASAEILENEFVCIVGPSGCGKSTLLRILAGLDEATGGETSVDDQPITGPGADRGMVFQTYTLFPWLTVEENICFGLKIKKMPKKQMEEIVGRYLKVIGLEAFRKSFPRELSGGMKQRVAIARALANSPKVLLMDEPFGALDAQTKAQMQLLMREIWQVEKPTVVFITHDIEEAVFLANRVYVMSNRPSRMVANIPILLPYNRELNLKEQSAFLHYRHQITGLLHQQTPGSEA